MSYHAWSWAQQLFPGPQPTPPTCQGYTKVRTYMSMWSKESHLLVVTKCVIDAALVPLGGFFPPTCLVSSHVTTLLSWQPWVQFQSWYCCVHRKKPVNCCVVCFGWRPTACWTAHHSYYRLWMPALDICSSRLVCTHWHSIVHNNNNVLQLYTDNESCCFKWRVYCGSEWFINYTYYPSHREFHTLYHPQCTCVPQTCQHCLQQ